MAIDVCEERSQPAVSALPPPAKVLVVDDDRDFRVLARKLLELARFEVADAADVSQGLIELRSGVFDAVIVDMIMPAQDGMDALREIKELFPGVRVVTVSGAEQSDLYLQISGFLGADASLNKSRVESLSTLLQVVLDR